MHDKHADFPITSEEQPIDPLELSDYQTQANNTFKVSAAKTHKLRQTFDPLELSDYQTQANITFKVSAAKTHKLRQTFYPKQHYVANNRKPKLFVEQGIKVTNNYQATKFQQSK